MAEPPSCLPPEKISADSNVATGLAALFHGVDRERLAIIRAESDELFPDGPFTLNPVQREKAIRFRQRYEDERNGARLALQRPECRFPIQYEAGPAEELTFLDTVWICSRLEAFRAAEALSALDVDTAVESLRYQLRLAECLAAEPHPVVRLEGAFSSHRGPCSSFRRSWAARILNGRHAIVILGLLSEQLATWPDDALAWIGDRAQGMVIYEAVRGGKLKAFLTDDEKQRLKESGNSSAFEDCRAPGT